MICICLFNKNYRESLLHNYLLFYLEYLLLDLDLKILDLIDFLHQLFKRVLSTFEKLLYLLFVSLHPLDYLALFLCLLLHTFFL